MEIDYQSVPMQVIQPAIISVTLPQGAMNIAVSIDNHLIADSNDSANWKVFRLPLPPGKWTIANITGPLVILSYMGEVQ